MKYAPPYGSTNPAAGYVDGNPAAGVIGSPVPAAAVEHPMREIVNVITGAGLTPSSTDLTQLRQAVQGLIAAAFGAITTPPQFDNDLSLATTEFVQRALGNCRALFGFTDSRVLTANHAGMFLVCGGTADTTVDLPSLAACPSGASLPYYNSGNFKVTLRCAANEKIAWHTAALGASSVDLRPGETLILVSPGGGATWYPLGGTALLKMPTGPMAFSLAGSGYQKLPSSLIIQWSSANVAAGDAQSFNLPITFPSVFLTANAIQMWNTSVRNGEIASVDIGKASLSQISLRHTASNVRQISYIAIGY